jgi:RNA polymerase sigma-70 factor, ECF subfamily
VIAHATDDELVVAAQRGERRAMDELLRRHYPRIHAVCSRIAGGTRDADDAAQEAMIRIVRAIDRFDGRSAFGTWAYRIATTAALDELRRRNRRPMLHVVDDDDDDERPREAADPVAHRKVDAVSDRIAIEQALATIPEDFRIPVVMRDIGDLDYAEIADELGVPIGTVKSRIARGRRLLLERLGNRDDHGERPSRATPLPDDPARPRDDQ